MSQPIVSGSLVARNTLINILGNGLPLIVGIFTIPWIIKGLGTDRFAILSLTGILAAYFSLFEFGLGRALTKFAAEAVERGDEESLAGLVWPATGLQVALGIIAATTFTIFIPVLTERFLKIPSELLTEARQCMYLFAFSIPVTLASTALTGLLSAGQRFALINTIKAPLGMSTLLLPLVGIALHLSLPVIVLSLVASRIVALVAYVLACKLAFPSLRTTSVRVSNLKMLVTFGGWLTVSDVLGPMLTYMDRFLLAGLVPIGAVTYYVVPYDAITRLAIVPAALVATLFPAMSSLQASGNREIRMHLFSRSVHSLLLLLGPLTVLILVFAEDLLRLWLGSEFAHQSSIILQCLALGVLFNALASVPSAQLQASGRPDITAKFHLVELPLHVLLVLVLVKMTGVRGAAIAWTIRSVLDAVFLFLATRDGGSKLLTPPAGQRGISKTVGLLAAFCLISYLTRTSLPWLWSRMVAIPILFLFMALALWTFVMDHGTRTAFRVVFRLRKSVTPAPD